MSVSSQRIFGIIFLSLCMIGAVFLVASKSSSSRTAGSFALTTAHAMSTTTSSTSSISARLHRILCYGDSLTAGTSGFDYYPYAPHLQRALEALRPSADNDGATFTVRHRGMPGWTAKQMLDPATLEDPQTGLRSAIRNVQNPSLSVVLILAGTNDLGYGYSVDDITQSVWGLHQAAVEAGVPRTIAIGVPPSGYQSVNAQAREMVQQINDNLKEKCQQNQNQQTTTTFVPFPFEYERGGENWYGDGLHFSEQGYKLLGEALAPTVLKVLEELEQQQ